MRLELERLGYLISEAENGVKGVEIALRDHPDIILMAADQGAVITVNGGQTWSSWYNQPTAQMYHVTTDNSWPYRVCSGQQESGSACVPSRGNDGQITFRDWRPVGVEEYGYVAPDPLDPNIVYGGKVTRFDYRTGQTQNVAPRPFRDANYRMLRTAPILLPMHDRVPYPSSRHSARWIRSRRDDRARG